LKPWGWVLVIRDVTNEREIQRRAQQQERLAAVGQLAAGIAHDFNNTLNVILGFSELLKMDPGIPEHAKQRLNLIIQQVQHGARLIRQILDFSRKSIPEKRPLELNSFLKESIKLLKRTIPENIKIIFESKEDEDFIVNADPSQIQQIIANLALNSQDAMPYGGEIRIQLCRFNLKHGERMSSIHGDIPSGEWIVISVSDTGVGIPRDILPRIFEPFFTTKEPGKGTGLGLAQVYGIVKQHDGFIDVESEVGRGTKFTIYLPALTGSVKAKGEERIPADIPSGSGEMILLVEDEPSVLEINKTMLEQIGYKVLTSRNGQEALKIYEKYLDRIKLVLTDMVMPEMGGMELFYALKEKNPDVKVIIMTGYPLESESQDLLSKGIVDWIQKPFSLPQLAKLLKKVLKG
jgi:nitrogen-specific signal transduction histidine kinase